ncbi:lysophospholipid acyltransferase family protein [Formosa algae]|uniref:1-acyl-sn-glycerol-3-phosphate acyltransferase n=1 Tax=Formosa algae TaxID=225843 RepID=A0A9X0YJY8_9FLAO|nr:lysophospholipid acyltransferase family protein [Formosa algae]MBP1840480.1 1-acyl-sn-glycerol-3-phosphate acyltransferase [Formosa algae]MDQ0336972.1 1-acyl-sn-glycerol-3-phosphate acyltransferase [Formosa algae]OEI80854.1 glycerol acyltransferase [Formosa algae]PNW28185.1 1-acyl-sn-glycerol-3-phosphate acyltransferase [Formosa algae]
MKLLAYPLTVLYAFAFLLSISIFHPILWISHRVFGYSALQHSVNALQFTLLRCLNILGTRFTYTNTFDAEIPKDKPLIIVSNHQSMYDISPILWYMREYHPKFISKIELGKGIPSVSYNLRHGGSALIDRKNPRQSIRAINEFSEFINEKKYAAVIFPEGTRSKDGVPKPFQRRGLQTLIKNIPTATVIPLTINNSWKTLKYGKFPMGLGAHITLTIHKPINLSTFTGTTDTLIDEIEHTVTQSINH